MKLSTAMYKGAKHRAQSRDGHFFYKEEVGVLGRITSCALGAAFEGLLDHPCLSEDYVEEVLCGEWVDLFDERLMHPETEKLEAPYNIVISLNDDYGWRRERIAAWLRTQGY